MPPAPAKSVCRNVLRCMISFPFFRQYFRLGFLACMDCILATLSFLAWWPPPAYRKSVCLGAAETSALFPHSPRRRCGNRWGGCKCLKRFGVPNHCELEPACGVAETDRN